MSDFCDTCFLSLCISVSYARFRRKLYRRRSSRGSRILNDGKTEFNSGDLCQLPLTILNPSKISEHPVNFQAYCSRHFPAREN